MADKNQNIRVLIVEDDFIQAETLSEKLKSLGFEPFGMADSFDKAIELVQDQRPDVALLDLHLKGEKTGFDLAREFMDNLEIPVVFISAYSDKATIEEIKSITPHAYLIKPFEQDELQILIQSAYERSQMYRALSDQSKWIHNILDNLNEGIVVTDSKGVIKLLNPHAEKLLENYAPFSLGRSFTEVTRLYNHQEEIFEDFKDWLENFSHDNNYFRICESMNSDIEWIEIDLKTIKKGNDKEYIISFRELSKAQEELRLQSKAIYNAPSPAIITNNDVDFGPHIEHANQAFFELSGYNQNEIIGKSVHILNDTDVEDQFFEDLKSYIQYGRSFQTNTCSYFNHSSPLNLKLKFSPIRSRAGEVTHWICTCEDMSEQLELQQQIKQSEARLRSILENSSEVLIFIDDNFKIQDFNTRAEEVIKKISDKKIETGSSIFTYLDDSLVSDFKSQAEKAMEGEQIRLQSHEDLNNGTSKGFEIDLTPIEHPETLGNGICIKIEEVEDKSSKSVTHDSDLITVINPDYKITFHEGSGSGDDDLNLPAGKNLLDFIHEDDHEAIKESVQEASENSDSFPTVDIRIKDRSGNWRNIQSVIENQSDNPLVQGLILNSRDITDIYETQKALEVSEERYEKLIERIPVGYFRTSPEGMLINVNFEFVQMLGYASTDELLHKEISNEIYFSPEERESALKQMEQLEGESHQLRLRKKDGSTIWVEEHALPRYDMDGRLIYYEGIIQDITERKKTEDILQKLAEGVTTSTGDLFFQSLSKNLAEFFDVSYARIIKINPEDQREAHTIASYGTDDFESNDPFDISGTILEKVITQDGIFLEPENVTQTYSDNYLKQLEAESFAGTNLLDKDNRPIGMLVVMNTKPIKQEAFVKSTLQIMASRASAELQRFNYEQQLIESKDEAEKLNRLKTNFLANMSHEIREPLNDILGYVSEIENNEDENSRKQNVQKIKESGNNLLVTLDSLIELAKLEADRVHFDLTEVNVAEHIKPVIDHFKPLAENKNLDLEADIKSDQGLIKADKIIFSQIIHNILDNALKFTDEGSISVEISDEVINDDDYAKITITDTGKGIDPEFLPQIFEEFKQEKEGINTEVRGIGLGLTITQRYVEYLGGTIDADSQKNKGTSFILRFPLISEPHKDKKTTTAPRVATDEKVSSAASLPDLLLLEDSPESRKICNLFLKNHLCVDTAENEDQALKKLQENQYDIVLIDIHLGHGGSGTSALSKLRDLESYKDTPVIAVSGYGTSGDRQKFIEAGFDDFISKPYTKNHLLSTIQSHLADLQTG